MRIPHIDRWMYESFRTSANGLAAYRILFASFALLIIAPGHDVYASLSGFAGLPASMFAPPPGPMRLFSGFPPPLVADGIHLLLNISLVALLLGYRTRWSSVLAGVLFLILYGFSYSLGKINHNLLFVLVPIVMSFSGWGAALSVDARRRRSHGETESAATASWPLPLLGLLLGFAMFTAGFAKILGGWLDPSTHAAYGHILKHVFVRGRSALLATAAVEMESGLLWECVDYMTVFFEAGFLAACLHQRSLRLFAGGAVLFHFGVMMSMNIAFAFNLIVYAAFVDWDGILDGFVRSIRRLGGGRWEQRAELDRDLAERNRRLARVLGVPAVLIGGWVFYTFGSPLLWLDRIFVLDSDLTAREVVVVTSAAVLVVVVALRRGVSKLRGTPDVIFGRLRQFITT